MKKLIIILLLWSPLSAELFTDLALVECINREINDHLPFFYNYSFVGGYFTMPSARMPASGMVTIGGASVPPYSVYGANLGVFNRIELSANYRVFRGCLESNFGREGFGDDADRIGNVKFGMLMPEDGFEGMPSIAFGLDDFIGTKRFSSSYFVATKEWTKYDFELSLGWGSGRIKGVFGGAVWTPFRQTEISVLKNISLIAEYDANDYKKHHGEHFKGRDVDFRGNFGLSYLLGETLQLTLSSLRGKKLAGSASLRYPLGTTTGLFAKDKNPLPYTAPVDFQALGNARPEEEFARDLAYSFADQGLDIYGILLDCSQGDRHLWIEVANNRYRKERTVRERIQNLLAALTPSDVDQVTVTVQSEGVKSHSYTFRTIDLYQYERGCMSEPELATVAPMSPVCIAPSDYEAMLLFQRAREVWTFTARPRLINFFGATSGKYKYSIGLIASMEGYLYNAIYYRVQGAYSAYSSMHGLSSRDRLNPSRILHVRTDAVRYYQASSVSLEELFLARNWNVGKGWFFRLAGGYFEPAYGGVASEFLLYPVQSSWAVGVEAATVLKRRYSGLGFFSKIPKFNNAGIEVFERYVGLQYFLNLYYDFKPLALGFEANIGQFLAKDKGVRIIATRYFPSGLRFSLWTTITNGGDKVNGRVYHDKGFAFHIPFDIFLRQSSRTFLTYAMSAWLRDVGAVAATGKTLYNTLYEERVD